MYCPYCGKEIPNTAVFCSHCGSNTTPKVEQSPPEPTVASVPVPPAFEPEPEPPAAPSVEEPAFDRSTIDRIAPDTSYTPPPPVQPSSYYQAPPPPAYTSFDAPPAASEGANGLAIASMVCGICAFVCCGIPGIVGLILGIISQRKSKSAGENGSGMALAGIICSSIAIGIWVLGFILSINGNANYRWYL